MNQELKKQAHKKFDEKFNNDYPHEMCEEGCCGYYPDIEEMQSFIDSLIDKTVQMTEERIVGMIAKRRQELKEYPLWNEFVKGEDESLEYIASLITNKSDINK